MPPGIRRVRGANLRPHVEAASLYLIKERAWLLLIHLAGRPEATSLKPNCSHNRDNPALENQFNTLGGLYSCQFRPKMRAVMLLKSQVSISQ
jgi:hypothetical protein